MHETDKDPTANSTMEAWEDDDKSNTMKGSLKQERPANSFNLAPVSRRDEIVWAAAAPGTPKRPQTVLSTREGTEGISSRGKKIATEEVQAWLNRVCAQRFLVLLSEGELAMYEEPLLDLLRSQSTEHKTHIEHVPNLQDKLATAKILQALNAAEKANEKIVIFCASGQVRTGTVSALWVHHHYFVALSDAVREVREFARSRRAIRLPGIEELMQLVSPDLANVVARRASSSISNAAGSKTSAGGGDVSVISQNRSNSFMGMTSIESAWNTPRTTISSARSAFTSHASSFASAGISSVDVLFVTTGGTIDKDYPRLSGGYAFEIGEPAVLSIMRDLRDINAVGSFSYSIASVCRKDSQDISEGDRLAIVNEIQRVDAKRVIVTHGTDTLIETAEFLHDHLFPDLDETIIVVTGALRPYKFRNSDALFNVGTALGALSTAQEPGVYIAMNGQVMPIADVETQVQRDPDSALFIRTPR